MRTTKIQLSGVAEELIDKLERIGINEKSAISKALWLLQQAYEGKAFIVNEDGNTYSRVNIK